MTVITTTVDALAAATLEVIGRVWGITAAIVRGGRV